MKVLLVNDTRVETNPGCHATVDELSKFISKNLTCSSINFLPLGTEYDTFSTNLFKKHKLLTINNFISKLVLGLSLIKIDTVFDFKLWKKLALNNLSVSTRELINSSNLIIINMEGTIHHNSTGGLALLAIAYYSKHMGKKVALVNGSYQEMDIKVTKLVLNEVDFVSVRETASIKYLKLLKIQSLLIPDFAFRADINSGKEISYDLNVDWNKKRCLYTAGVLGVYPNQVNGIPMDTIKRHISDIKELGYKVYYLKIEEKEIIIERELYKLGVEVISYSHGIVYSNIGTLLNAFDLLVTGRYHIGIFGLMNKIPTFFLKSNTFKIEGLLDMLDLNERLILNNNIYRLKNRISNKKKYILPNDESYSSFKEFLERVHI